MGQINAVSRFFSDIGRFIPTRVGQITDGTITTAGDPRFIPTRVGQIINSGYIRVYYIRLMPKRVGQVPEGLHYNGVRVA